MYVEVQVIITPSAHSIDVVRPQEPKSLPEGRYLLVPVEDAGRLVDREATEGRLVREHLEMWQDVVMAKTDKRDKSLDRALAFMGGPIDE